VARTLHRRAGPFVGKRGPRLRPSKLRIFVSWVWPKAIFTVAWGNAPGTGANIRCLAEGHIHRRISDNVSMAFGQKKPNDTVALGRCPRLRWEQAFGQARTDCEMHNFKASVDGRQGRTEPASSAGYALLPVPDRSA